MRIVRERIMEELRWRGPLTAYDLAQALGMDQNYLRRRYLHNMADCGEIIRETTHHLSEDGDHEITEYYWDL